MLAAADVALAVDPGLDLPAMFSGLIDAGAFTSVTHDGCP
jgi:hypothetical protein